MPCLLQSMIGYWHLHVVCPSVCLWRCALWLWRSVYRAKGCTNVQRSPDELRSRKNNHTPFSLSYRFLWIITKLINHD